MGANIGVERAAEKEVSGQLDDELGWELFLAMMVLYAVIVLIQIVMVIWMLVALVQTIQYLQTLEAERTTQLRYLRLRAIASMATFMGSTTSALLWISPVGGWEGGLVSPITWTFHVSWLHDAISLVHLPALPTCGVPTRIQGNMPTLQPCYSMLHKTMKTIKSKPLRRPCPMITNWNCQSYNQVMSRRRRRIEWKNLTLQTIKTPQLSGRMIRPLTSQTCRTTMPLFECESL